MKRKILLLPIFFLLFCVSSAFAEDEITWSQCVSETLKSNPQLIAARERLVQAKRDLAITKHAFFPSFGVYADSTRSKVTSQENADNIYSYGVTGNQLVFDGLKTNYDI